MQTTSPPKIPTTPKPMTTVTTGTTEDENYSTTFQTDATSAFPGTMTNDHLVGETPSRDMEAIAIAAAVSALVFMVGLVFYYRGTRKLVPFEQTAEVKKQVPSLRVFVDKLGNISK